MAQTQVAEILATFSDHITALINGDTQLQLNQIEPYIEECLNENLQHMTAHGEYPKTINPAHENALLRYLADLEDGKVTVESGAARLPNAMALKSLVRLKTHGIFDPNGIVNFCIQYFVTPLMVKRYSVKQLLYYAASIPYHAPKAIVATYPDFVTNADDLYHIVLAAKAQPKVEPATVQPKVHPPAAETPKESTRPGPVGSDNPEPAPELPPRRSCYGHCRMPNVTTLIFCMTPPEETFATETNDHNHDQSQDKHNKSVHDKEQAMIVYPDDHIRVPDVGSLLNQFMAQNIRPQQQPRRQATYV